MHKEGGVILRSFTDQGALSHAFSLTFLPRISTPLTPKMMTCMGRKANTTKEPSFPSSPVLLIGGRKVESVNRLIVHGSRGKVEAVELDLYSVALLVSHTREGYVCQATKYQCVILGEEMKV